MAKPDIIDLTNETDVKIHVSPNKITCTNDIVDAFEYQWSTANSESEAVLQRMLNEPFDADVVKLPRIDAIKHAKNEYKVLDLTGRLVF